MTPDLRPENSPLLKAAIFYHSLGWSIIPIKANSKLPAIGSWSEFQKRRATLAELEQWFGRGNFNIALVCGEISGVAAIDDDTYKTQGNQIKLVSTLTQNSPSGGKHYFFQCPEGLRPAVNAELAVDIRANGSYVLLAPSTINGVSYTWTTRKTANFKNLTVLPLAYLEKIRPQNPGGGAVHEAVDFSTIYGTKNGSRDISLYRSACSLLARDLPSELVYKFLLFLNDSFTPPLPEIEVQKKFQSAVRFILKDWDKTNG